VGAGRASRGSEREKTSLPKGPKLFASPDSPSRRVQLPRRALNRGGGGGGGGGTKAASTCGLCHPSRRVDRGPSAIGRRSRGRDHDGARGEQPPARRFSKAIAVSARRSTAIFFCQRAGPAEELLGGTKAPPTSFPKIAARFQGAMGRAPAEQLGRSARAARRSLGAASADEVLPDAGFANLVAHGAAR